MVITMYVDLLQFAQLHTRLWDHSIVWILPPALAPHSKSVRSLPAATLTRAFDFTPAEAAALALAAMLSIELLLQTVLYRI